MQTKLNIKSSSKIFIADSASLKIGDPSVPPPEPTYNLYFRSGDGNAVTSISENNDGHGFFQLVLETTNVPADTLIPFTVSGVSENDFVSEVNGQPFALYGNTIIANWAETGEGGYDMALVEDFLTEGPETMVVILDGITPTVSAALIINDTSVAPVPTYNLYFADEFTSSTGEPSLSANEGNYRIMTLMTTGVSPGTVFPYTITGISQEDVDISLTGNLTLDYTGSVELGFTIAEDLLTEGPETMVVILDGITPTVSAALVINDTSVAPVAAGPILFYDATNTASYPGTGTSIYDLTTNSLTGTLVGGPTFNNVSGDKYFTWTTGDYLYTPTLDESSVVKALTGDRPQHSVEVWSYPTVASRIMFTYNSSVTENTDYHFSAMELAGGKAYFGLWTPSGLVSTPTPVDNVSTGAWHQFVLVYDSTTIIGYVDGVEQSRTTTDINFSTPYELPQGNLRMMFGAFSATNSGGSTQRFSGRWRKMRVYNQALTPSQVLANYNAG